MEGGPLHARVVALDTHNDINPSDFTRERNYTQRLDTQVNLPKMTEGGLDASFFVDNIDYAVKLIGIDHVGISFDFDGGGGVAGWNDASETFNVTLELVRRGYTESQIAKIWSGNLLRVMELAGKVARNLQSSTSSGGARE
jgi:microsomal dipeptidase-like Zn-dependent dipeptidase